MIVDRVKTILKEGVVEIWITSEDVGAYGIDIGVTIVDLLWEVVKAMEECHPYAKLRVGMTNPPYILEHVEEMAKILSHPRVYSFIHIPVQSGSDSVLDAMKRKYTVNEFKKVVYALREGCEGVTIATDIICGFPTETEEDFEKTMDLMRECRFPITHISQFYPRPGTPAAKMKRVPTGMVKDRSRKITTFFESYETYGDEIIGTEQEVLVTEVNSGSGDLYVGHNRYYNQVLVPRQKNLLGKMCRVKITKKGKYFLMGEVVEVLKYEGFENEEVTEEDVGNKKRLVPKFVRKKRNIVSVNNIEGDEYDDDTKETENDNEESTHITLEESLNNFHFPRTNVGDVCCGGNGETCDCHKNKDNDMNECCGGNGEACNCHNNDDTKVTTLDEKSNRVLINLNDDL